MRSIPEDEYDQKELARLNAEPWMVEQLKLNPEYNCWGPGEDYMKGRRENGGWDCAMEVASWKKLELTLNDLNECVNFHFEIQRDSKDCRDCDKSGYNPETKIIADDFYDFAERGTRWCDKITQDELETLQKEGRICDWDPKKQERVPMKVTVEEVNASNSRGGFGNFGQHHDGINRMILIEARAKRLGVWGLCSKCDGQGYIYTAPGANLALILWILHPRKGASRGVEIKSIEKDDLPSVYKWLREADERNRERFSKIPGPAKRAQKAG